MDVVSLTENNILQWAIKTNQPFTTLEHASFRRIVDDTPGAHSCVSARTIKRSRSRDDVRRGLLLEDLLTVEVSASSKGYILASPLVFAVEASCHIRTLFWAIRTVLKIRSELREWLVGTETTDRPTPDKRRKSDRDLGLLNSVDTLRTLENAYLVWVKFIMMELRWGPGF